ncbi:MAG: enterochelin esterase [Chloroflexota bacterium]|nr:enterochelin esterase [Chloroflexota bacterium]
MVRVYQLGATVGTDCEPHLPVRYNSRWGGGTVIVEEHEILVSPRLLALERQLAAGGHDALESFWRRVGGHGAPLIETTRHGEHPILVTFLWRAGDVEDVVLVGGLAGWTVAGNRMTRLPGTDLWYKTYRTWSPAPAAFRLLPGAVLEQDWSAAGAHGASSAWRPNDLEVFTYAFPVRSEATDIKQVLLAMVKLPDAPPQPWITPAPGSPVGQVTLHYLHSAILGNSRHIWVYTPPGYAMDGGPHDVLIQFDGMTYTDQVSVPTVLDNLQYEGRIAPTVAVLIDNIDHETRMREFGCHVPFVSFLTDELLPWVRKHYSIATEPSRTTVSGSSMGGLAAAFAGLERPDVFGKVLSQSGSFWWKPDGEREHEWLARRVVESPLLPLRFYLEVGVHEQVSSPDSGPTQVVVNRHMRDVLRAKGYPVHYSEFEGGHDWACWRDTLHSGIIALNGRD